MSNKRIIDLPSGSINDNQLAFMGDPGTGQLFEGSYKQLKDYFIAGISGSRGTVDTSSLVTQTQFANFTGSNNTSIANVFASESNYLPTSSFNTYSGSTGGTISNVFASQSNYTSTSSYNALSASYSTDSGSFNSRILAVPVAIQNAVGPYELTSSFNTYTASVSSQIANVFASESNYTLTSSFNTLNTGFSNFSGSYVIDSASFNSRLTGSGATPSLQAVTTIGASSTIAITSSDIGFTSGSFGNVGGFSLLRAMSNYFQGYDNIVVGAAIIAVQVSASVATWSLLTSSNHTSMFFSSVTANSSTMQLNFTSSVSECLSFVMSNDDSEAPYGVHYGAAINTTNCIISLWAPVAQNVILTTASSAAWSAIDQFAGGATATYNTSSGVTSINGMVLTDGIARGLVIPTYAGGNPYMTQVSWSAASVNQMDFNLINYTNGQRVSGSVLNGNDIVHIGNMHPVYRQLNLTSALPNSYESKVYAGLSNFQVIGIFRK